MECTAPNTCTCISGWTSLNGTKCTRKYTITLHSNINAFVIIAICTIPCGVNQQCTAPDTCTCASGYTLSGTICARKFRSGLCCTSKAYIYINYSHQN